MGWRRAIRAEWSLVGEEGEVTVRELDASVTLRANLQAYGLSSSVEGDVGVLG